MPNLEAIREHYEASILAYERAYARYTDECARRDLVFRAGKYTQAQDFMMGAWRQLRLAQQAMNQAHADHYHAVVQHHA